MIPRDTSLSVTSGMAISKAFIWNPWHPIFLIIIFYFTILSDPYHFFYLWKFTKTRKITKQQGRVPNGNERKNVVRERDLLRTSRTVQGKVVNERLPVRGETNVQWGEATGGHRSCVDEEVRACLLGEQVGKAGGVDGGGLMTRYRSSFSPTRLKSASLAFLLVSFLSHISLSNGKKKITSLKQQMTNPHKG